MKMQAFIRELFIFDKTRENMKKLFVLLFLVGALQIDAVSNNAEEMHYAKKAQALRAGIISFNIITAAISFNGLMAVKKLRAKVPPCPKNVIQLGKRSFFAYTVTAIFGPINVGLMAKIAGYK